MTYVASVRDHFLSEGHDVSVLAGGRMHFSDGDSVPLESSAPDTPLQSMRRRIVRKIDHWHGSLPSVARRIAGQLRIAHSIAPMDVFEMEESFGWSGHVARVGPVPVVTRLHGPQFLKPDRIRTAHEERCDRQRDKAEGRAIGSVSSLTAPTRAIMNATCQRYGRQGSDLSAVIPNPVALAPEQARWRLDGCDPEHILMVGRFDFWKGADVMLSAFDQLIARRPTARLTLVGPDVGIEVAPGRRLMFEEYARTFLSPAARQRISFLGMLPPDQIRALRKQAFVAVIASRCENFPYVLLEALSAGSPVISSDWSGSEEIIAHGETGLLTPLGDAEALSRSLDELMSEPETACRMAAAGLRTCENNYSLQSVGARLLDHYRATVERAAR